MHSLANRTYRAQSASGQRYNPSHSLPAANNKRPARKSSSFISVEQVVDENTPSNTENRSEMSISPFRRRDLPRKAAPSRTSSTHTGNLSSPANHPATNLRGTGTTVRKPMTGAGPAPYFSFAQRRYVASGTASHGPDHVMESDTVKAAVQDLDTMDDLAAQVRAIRERALAALKGEDSSGSEHSLGVTPGSDRPPQNQPNDLARHQEEQREKRRRFREETAAERECMVMCDMVKTSLSSKDPSEDSRMALSLQAVVSVLHQVLTENTRFESDPKSTLTVPAEEVGSFFENNPDRPTSRDMFQFMYNIAYRIRFRPELGIAALIYIDRLIEKTGIVYGRSTWRRVTFAGMVLAQKGWEDSCYDNKDYARTFKPLTVRTVNRIEREFLCAVGHDLSVHHRAYTKYASHLMTLKKGAWYLGNERTHGVERPALDLE
ncbi:Cyclin PHO80-like [Carpediemonas membranifera]|uniref:Cyclin PHO80-like n=1 Tax=Carpediemonas membranifera TaxID=201153 RepID=A0A8J6B550_9EUKA|nr:Cyclin PHO80-like [Carpediemonas membranifera]|eukprot:KAG9393077.1 Cyclin PHO80-like [Carpediemonas membranifera]